MTMPTDHEPPLAHDDLADHEPPPPAHDHLAGLLPAALTAPVHADDPAGAAPSAPRGRTGPVEWLLRRDAIANARAVTSLGPEAARDAQRGRLAAELAARAFDPVDPLRAGPSTTLATQLYRQAAYWLLLAHEPTLADAPDLASAFDRSDPTLLAFAAGDDGPTQARRVLVEGSFVLDAESPPDAQTRDVNVARRFVDALIENVDRPARPLRRALLQRALRIGLVALLAGLVASIVGFAAGRVGRGSNLAAGKPWRTSSTYKGFSPKDHIVDGNESHILFHTDEEAAPWYEIDLGPGASYSSVEIVNRSDCCSERAFPLAVEVSDDRNAWREVARRAAPFSVWTASFPRQTARFVRVRALKRTWLHLERVAVHH